jgi:hypothetical protein
MSQEQENQDRLSSVVLSEHSHSIISETDIEAQIDHKINLSEKDKETLKISSQNQVMILKSILKTQPSIEQNRIIEQKIIIYCIWILSLIVCLPIVICDLYFAYNDHTCVNQYSPNIELNLKEYLVVSAINTFIIVNTYMFIINYTINNEHNQNIYFTVSTFVLICLLGLFALVWNILGAVIFWGSIYGQGHCSKKVSTYLFVSLIIKFVLTINAYKKSKNSFEEKKK